MPRGRNSLQLAHLRQWNGVALGSTALSSAVLARLLSVVFGFFCALLLTREARSESLVLNRAVVRFYAPETGGSRTPHFIFERALAFEARLEALGDPDHSPDEGVGYRERHVRAALERHIAETVLATLHIDPEPTVAELDTQTRAARLMLTARVGGPAALDRAAQAEGIDERALLQIVRRQARASLYLDRMVTPMLVPGHAELRAAHRVGPLELRPRPFLEVEAALRQWLVSRRLAAAVVAFYQNTRARLTISILP